ncbi:MAG: polysaccharide biosynthesis protein [Gemmatimonadetes bacterium]|nr:polysaccharide biosynthesis protein [Gemmatimonadota bacterium]
MAASTHAPQQVEPAVARRGVAPRPVRNVVITWAAFVFTVAVNFFVAPYVVRTLGSTVYGTWVLLSSLVGYMGLLDLGVRSAVMRYLALHHARAEDVEAGRSASAGLVIFGALGLVAVVAALVCAAVLPRFFTIPPDTVATARIVVVVGGLGVAVSLISGVFGGSLAALQRFDLQGLIGIVVGGLRAAAIVIGLGPGAGLLGLSLIQLAATVCQGTAQYVLTRRLYPELKLALRGLERAEIRRIFSFSMYSSLLHVSAALIFSADALVIGSFLPVAMITFFAIPSTLTDYTRSIVSAISQTITPRASSLEGVGAMRELETVLLRAATMATLVTLAITVTFIARGGSFIGLWMGAGFAELSGSILVILAISVTFDSARRVAMSALIGMNRHRQLAPFYLLEGVVNIALSVYWIRSMGLRGVALGTTVPNLITAFLVIPWLVRKVVGTPIRRFWLVVWIRPVLAMLPFAAVSYAVERGLHAQSLLSFFASVFLSLPVAIVGAWFVGIPAQDRSEYAQLVKSRLGVRG